MSSAHDPLTLPSTSQIGELYLYDQNADDHLEWIVMKKHTGKHIMLTQAWNERFPQGYNDDTSGSSSSSTSIAPVLTCTTPTQKRALQNANSLWTIYISALSTRLAGTLVHTDGPTTIQPGTTTCSLTISPKSASLSASIIIYTAHIYFLLKCIDLKLGNRSKSPEDRC